MTKSTRTERTHERTRRSQDGLTLLEVLIAMAIMGVIMIAFTQLFGGSLRASSDISARNELLSEGQIAEQIIVSRLKQAFAIYPSGTSFTMTNTLRTRNTLRGGQSWTVGTDPIIAMLVPPRGSAGAAECNNTSQANRDMCFMFYAYYPIRRGDFMAGVNPRFAPQPDPANDDAWLLMEYRQHIFDAVPTDRSNNRLANPPTQSRVFSTLGGSAAQILVDYAQPPTGNGPPLFDIQPDGSIELNVKMGREQRGKMLELPPLTVRVYPRNALDAPAP